MKIKTITEEAHQLKILENMNVLHLGLVDHTLAYVVPVNFHVDLQDAHVLFVHTRCTGKKIELIQNQNVISIQADRFHNQPITIDEEYYPYVNDSLMGSVKVEWVLNIEDKRNALMRLNQKYQSENERSLSDAFVENACILKLTLLSLEVQQFAYLVNPYRFE